MHIKNKGFTMLELMVSIAIISVVMIFLVQMLLDVRYDSMNEQYNSANQITRAEIIKTIEDDLKNKNVLNVTFTQTPNQYKFTFYSNIGNTDFIINYPNDAKNMTFQYGQKKWKLKWNNADTYIEPCAIVKMSEIPHRFDEPKKVTYELDIPMVDDKSFIAVDKNDNNRYLKNDSKMDNIYIVFSSSNLSDGQLNMTNSLGGSNNICEKTYNIYYN